MSGPGSGQRGRRATGTEHPVALPEVRVGTSYGTLLAAAVNGHRVHFRTRQQCAIAEDDVASTVTLSRVDYRVSLLIVRADAVLGSDHLWRVEALTEVGWAVTYSTLTSGIRRATERRSHFFGEDRPTDAAVSELADRLVPELASWFATKPARRVIQRAERRELRGLARQARRAIAELQREVQRFEALALRADAGADLSEAERDFIRAFL